MANLRGLLGKEFASTITDTAAVYGSYTRVRDGMVFNFMPYCNRGNCEQSYHDYCINHWCVPCGTTQLTFELWGGGGSGGGACCCQQGIPGGAGSYVRKTLQYPQIQGGWCYTMVVASPTCCSQCCCGIQGCKSYITGCNLTNLCAEGGLPGKTCCYAFWGNEFRCQDRVYFDGCGGWTPGTHQSNSYGGDEMIPGGPGFFRTYNNSNTCWAKIGMSYPGRLIDHKGGHIMSNNRGDACNQERTYCNGTTPWAYSTHCNGGPGIPGVGAPSATSCANSCCYGWRGQGGFIKITYCSCWLGVNNDCAFHFCN